MSIVDSAEKPLLIKKATVENTAKMFQTPNKRRSYRLLARKNLRQFLRDDAVFRKQGVFQPNQLSIADPMLIPPVAQLENISPPVLRLSYHVGLPTVVH